MINELIFTTGDPIQAWVRLNDISLACREGTQIKMVLKANGSTHTFNYETEELANTALQEMLRGINIVRMSPMQFSTDTPDAS